MRLALTAVTGGAAAALAAGGILGVAGAESTGSSSNVRTISVGGVAQVPIPQGASAATANAVYRQALAAAIADGLNKAEFLASHTSATVGPAHSVNEGGGYIDCTGGGESYVAYEGEQPDFPNSPVGPVPLAAGAAPAVGAPVPGRRLARSRHRRAHRAAAGACTLHASVSLTYEIG
jgi:Protein of unknown function (DUF541)